MLRSVVTELASVVHHCVRSVASKQVDLAGYSLGGLIACYYVQRLGRHACVGTAAAPGQAATA